jgi:hypothetical protein
MFQYYQSATVHTDKFRFPTKIFLLGALGVSTAAFAATSFLGTMSEKINPQAEQIMAAEAPESVLSTVTPSIPSPIPKTDESEEPIEPEFVYLGWEKSSSGIEFYFRDNWKGLLLTMSDFSQYKKVGSGVQLTMHLPSGLRTFEIVDRELASLLP